MRTYRLKQSGFEKIINKVLIFNLILMVLLSIMLALANFSFDEEKHWYLSKLLKDEKDLSDTSFISLYFILLGFIPIELPFAMEIGRFVSTFYAENDTQLIQLNKQTSEFSKLRVNNFGSLNEDLANISHICCDKTGTLTKNELIFR